MVCDGPLRAALSLQAALMSLSSVSRLILERYVPSNIFPQDDPQMPGLIPLIKKIRPDLPIVYRSHIEIRSDLVHVKGSPQAEVWDYLWNNIQHADLFISE